MSDEENTGSVASADQLAQRVDRETSREDKLAVVVSELRKVTEILGRSAEQIMESAERIQNKADNVDDEVMTIITACSFHDESGQRISRAETQIQQIDEMLRQIGVEIDETAHASERSDGTPSATGPSDDGAGQDEIDALMDDD